MRHLRKSTVVSAGLVATAFLLGAGTALAAAAGDPVAGKQVFDANCFICHSAESGAAHKIGPNLFGVVGAESAEKQGYLYSVAMQGAGLTWDEENLKAYLAAPARLVPGTKMGFPGFSNETDEANLIAYLATLK